MAGGGLVGLREERREAGGGRRERRRGTVRGQYQLI